MFPAIISENHFGFCLIAAADMEAGTTVARFEGKIVPYKDVPEDEICYVLLLEEDQWMICPGPARYINHSCYPNCRITDDRNVVTIQPLKKGDECTISYNIITREEYHENPEYYFWDSRWSFKCMCGSENCAGLINGYRFK